MHVIKELHQQMHRCLSEQTYWHEDEQIFRSYVVSTVCIDVRQESVADTTTLVLSHDLTAPLYKPGFPAVTLTEPLDD